MILPATILVISVLLMLAYALLIRRYDDAFTKSRKNFSIADTEATQHVTVIIPARNESANIKACLSALMAQTYPRSLMEIIVVDDLSEDDTAEIVKNFPVKLIRNNPKPGTIAFKKQAIATGISQASGALILTTDADCIVANTWVSTMVNTLQSQRAYMVTGPVKMMPGNQCLSMFQSLDFAILQGITAASVGSGIHDMSSGANLAYIKSFYHEVGGFNGIDDIASGDDMLLMQKFSAQYPGSIGYAFSMDAMVNTKTEPTWKLFLQQRIRWASKATKYKDPVLFRILLLVYAVNLWVVALLVMGLWNRRAFVFGLILMIIKLMIEWRFVQNVLQFFSLLPLMRWFPIAQPLHILYTVVSGFFGQAGGYRWKGRNVK
ncbi:MAG: glycosyltransferase [Sphingobacteriales bacterium]|jgi:glycosyltransferase involved in cell wall biosynthesis